MIHRMLGGNGTSPHTDEAADRSLVKKMVKPSSLTGKKTGGTCHSKGGAAGKKRPKTQVNVVVAPRGDGARAVPVPVGGPTPGAAGATLPSRPSAPAVPPTGGLGALAGAPMAKRGGKIKKRAAGGLVKRVTGYDAGDNGIGRLEKAAHMRRMRKE